MRNNKGIILSVFLIIILLCGNLFSADLPGSVKLTILYDNDIHGRLIPYDDSRWGMDIAGAARRAYLIQQFKKENPNTLVLSAGDLISGTPISGFYKGKVDYGIFQEMGYDALVIGNHEFDFGQDPLREFIQSNRVPVLSANTFESDSVTLLTKPYLIKEFNGLKIAIVGLTTPETPLVTHPKNIQGLYFEDPVMTAQRLIPELRKKADLIIGLTHLGFREDLDLAQKISGFDVIVGGHSHTKVDGFVQYAGAIIVQDYQWGINLGKLDLVIENKRIKETHADLIPITSQIPDDPKITKILKPYLNELKAKMDQRIGLTEVDLIQPNSNHIETNLAVWITDIFRQKVNADIALQNTGGVRAGISKGSFTYNDLYNVLPFENLLTLLEVNGKELQEILDDLSDKIEKGQSTSSVSGVEFTVMNGKATNILITNKPLDYSRTYRIAVNDFMANGGSGYGLLKKAKLIRYDDLLRDIIIDYLKDHPVISPVAENRIKRHNE